MELHMLRDGSFTADERLDRLIQFDQRSRGFAVADRIAERPTASSRTWRLGVRNDQGREGACVGFGIGHRLAADPLRVAGVDNEMSYALYKEAQKLDPWPGEAYEGTSVLAGVKAAVNRGRVKSYYWCFSIEDYINALLAEGPVVVGTWWKDSMWRPDSRTGYLDTSGENVGGHCWLLRGVDLRKEAFRMTNSWGRDWGQNGDAWVSIEDFERDLMPDGEGVVLYETRPPRKRDPRGRFTLGLPLGHWWMNGCRLARR